MRLPVCLIIACRECGSTNMSKTVILKCPWLAADGSSAKVLHWLVTEGQTVEIDQDIMVMQLNQEEFLLPASEDGVIQSLLVEPGEWIEPDQELAIIEIEIG
jgi:pyruvate/2-oxoglutarate dehydrogenase complex dihydrolipoamide acyltransferase (E2) component